jgi:voltage-gated potassium channel
MKPALTRWERATELPLVALAVAFLAAYAWPVLDPGLDRPWRLACGAVVWAAWALFAVDYAVRLVQSADRRRWFVSHLLDLAVIALPLLRPLRLLRLVSLLRVLNRSASAGLRGRVGAYVAVGSTLMGFVAAVAVLDAERDAPRATITTFGDAAWWAATTMTTVGYGDLYPVTTAGRWIAVGLMVAGLALLGAVSATLASWLVESVTTSTVEELDAQDDRADEAVRAELAGLRRELARLAEDLRRAAPDSLGALGSDSLPDSPHG